MSMKAGEERVGQAFVLMTEIGIIAQLATHAFESRMPSGLTMAQFSVLNHLVRMGGSPTPAELAGAMQVTKGAMTNTVGHLERRGLAKVAPHERDGRSKRVSLTDAGRDEREAAIAALAPELGALADSLGDERMAAALPVLADIRRFLDERRG